MTDAQRALSGTPVTNLIYTDLRVLDMHCNEARRAVWTMKYAELIEEEEGEWKIKVRYETQIHCQPHFVLVYLTTVKPECSTNQLLSFEWGP